MSRTERIARLARHARRGRVRAFTLVELAIVVAIVGVLSVIAVVGYRKITLSAKVSEAQNMISAIRIAQEDYKVERGTYATISATVWCPSDGVSVVNVKTGWDTTCGGGAGWGQLPVHVDGPVQFGYKTIGGLGGTALPAVGGWIDMTAATAMAATKPWYVVMAQADLNGDGASGLKTELVGTSFQNTIFSHQEGE
ncbi:MAG TPA: prepilin-type N-terminal cleavage/methylation domain-containing protein [Labilithrix sp.]|nr:prepilin-type N-terminal cleavage/methylation domain-containing protein [Labilithrix sp.]